MAKKQTKAEQLKRKSRQEYKQNYCRDRKVRLIHIMGGKCNSCGLKYNNENARLFQFHHRKPTQKKISLNLAQMGIAWKKLVKEAKKCKLLCANCHSLIHGGKY